METKIDKLKQELSNQEFLSKAPISIIEKKRQQLKYLEEGEKQDESQYLLIGSEYYEVIRMRGREFDTIIRLPKVVIDNMIYESRVLPDYTNVNEAYHQTITHQEIKQNIKLWKTNSTM